MKKGFTLIEILAAVLIAGALAAIALPQFTKAMEKAKEKKAIAYLRVIAAAEKAYYGREKAFVSVANAASIKSVLGVEVTDDDYDFRVILQGTNRLFSAQAIKKGTGPAPTISLDQDGNFQKNGNPYLPEGLNT